MELYILETIVAIIFAIIITIFFKLGKIRKVGISLAILMILLIIVLGITFILEKPIINITNQQSDLEVKQNAAINIPKTFYHFKDVTDTVKVIGNIDFNRVGTYEVKYEIPTLIGTYTVNQTVNIVDTTAPKIILNGEELYNQSYSKEYIEPGYTVSDNYDENLTEKVQVTKEDINEKEYNIIYTVVDSSGNKTNATRKVCIIDDIAPVIKLNGSENIQILVNSKYEEKGATANDEKDGDLTSKIETTGNVDTSKVGTYTITGLTPVEEDGSYNTYSIEVTISDKLMVLNTTEVYSTAAPVFHWGKNDFEFNVPVHFNRGFTNAAGIKTAYFVRSLSITGAGAYAFCTLDELGISSYTNDIYNISGTITSEDSGKIYAIPSPPLGNETGTYVIGDSTKFYIENDTIYITVGAAWGVASIRLIVMYF